MLARIWNNWNADVLVERMQNGTVTWEKAILLLYIDLREMKTKVHILAVFILAENWRQFKCPTTSEWINKL